MSEISQVSQNRKKKLWRIIFCVVLLINVVVFCDTFFLGNARNLALFFFHLNPYHWQTWYAINLWLLAFGKFTAMILSWIRIRRNKFSFYTSPYLVWLCVGLGIFVVTFYYSYWFAKPRNYLILHRYFLYQSIYVPYCYSPFTEFISNGKITWKLFTIPIIAFLIITGLLRLNKKTKGTKHDP
ncbi:MAG: hypothetical protein LBT05_10955 [Planctomycetaceae bacterium]|jgi:hypothetical protein|nr:hypothetical protein [Planctomycetaceae bacterium]